MVFVYNSCSIYPPDALQCLRLHLLFEEYGSSHMRLLNIKQAVSIHSALTLQMSIALREVRRLSYVHHWRVSVTPPAFVIYAVYHITLGLLYIGQTHMAPIQRLRKHMTDAAASVDGSSLHMYMQRADTEGWGIVVLEYVQGKWWAGVCERHWWFTLKRWAVNDVPPGIPQEGAEQHNN